MGRVGMAIAPTSVSKMEQTMAKTGLRMKKSTNTAFRPSFSWRYPSLALLPAKLGSIPCSAAARRGGTGPGGRSGGGGLHLHGHAVAQRLQRGHGDAVALLQSPLDDVGQVSQRAEDDGTALHHRLAFLVLHHHGEGLTAQP